MRNNWYITNLKYKLLRTLRNSSNEEPGNKITQTMEKRTVLKEIVIMVKITMIRSILRQMFRVLLREIEDLCSFPHLTFQALQNCKQKGTVWKIRDCCCCLEVSLVCVLYYNRECSWKPVLPSIVCVLHSHMDSHGLNQSTFVGILPLWYRNFWRSTLFQRDQLWNFTLWHLGQSNSEKQFLFTKELRCTLSKWRS